MNLLPRFWDVQSGAIRIDGHDLRDVQLRSLRSQIGMVIQETTLFNDTVANNIAYGNRHAGREAIVAAAKRAYAHQFIIEPARRLRHDPRRAGHRASPAASGSGSPWPGPCSATRRS